MSPNPPDYSIKDLETIVTVDGTVKNIEVTRLTAPGENYVSLVLRVDIDVEKDGKKKTVKTIGKRLPLGNNEMRSKMAAHAMKNEIKFYREIVPLLTEFASTYEVDASEFFAKYYGSRFSLDDSSEDADRDSILLLENIIPLGYKNEDRHIGFDLDTSKAILKRLALFHSIPIALRSKDAENFKILKDFLVSCRPFGPPGGGPPGDGPPGGPHKGPSENGPEFPSGGPPNGPPRGGPPGGFNFPDGKHPHQVLLKTLKDIPELSPYIDRLSPLMGKMGPPGAGKPGTEPWGTFAHNDFWVNNMMIKSEPGKEISVKLVDFQICGYRSFATDLVFFLLTSLKNDVFLNNFDELLRFYYGEFTKNLKRFELDLELSYDEYLKEVEEAARDSEIPHSIFFAIPILADKNPAVDIAVEDVDMFSELTRMVENLNQRQKDKMVLLIKEASKRNWI
ncbi:uncharacterized protein LOC115890907 [Sitophilus oryzae]|uniref:Uncharacterized protein LOC115890907 n=1 Tax=Sitophilus oryzae TaxID=7048 RepID=A0A6J2YV19_SITOR|nr:uncharacterized protein LOC115890907 [Sitophilus oryzae]XP_030767125.1 uncharacterized protein LOC115890907 [Sitophilus oryzae]